MKLRIWCIVILITMAPASFGQSITTDMPNRSDYASQAAFLIALDRWSRPVLAATHKAPTNGPSDLAREKTDCVEDGIPVQDATLTIPAAEDAYGLYRQWKLLAPTLPSYADPLLSTHLYSTGQLATVQKIIDDNPKAFALLRTAAAKPYVVASQTDVAMFRTRREAARVLRTEAYLLARHHEYARAISTASLSLNIGKQGNIHSSLIGYLVSRAIDGISLSDLQDIMTVAGPDRQVDESVAHTLTAALPVVSLKDGLTGDVAKWIPEYNGIRPVDPKDSPQVRKYMIDLYDTAESRYLANQIVLVHAADLPTAQRQVVYAHVDATIGSPNRPNPVDMVLTIATPYDAASLDQADDEIKAKEQVTLAAAAVLDAKAKTGDYPATMPRSFLDPFTGDSLGYTLNGQIGFTIYSVGKTGKYDGKSPNNSEAYFTYPASAPVPAATQWQQVAPRP